jgi:hypothetical protein
MFESEADHGKRRTIGSRMESLSDGTRLEIVRCSPRTESCAPASFLKEALDHPRNPFASYEGFGRLGNRRRSQRRQVVPLCPQRQSLCEMADYLDSLAALKTAVARAVAAINKSD